MLCLREPSMGPVFGVKGGGTGGGYAQVVPMEDINLHFNGDFHAVTAAHNLLAAALDASIYNGNPLRIDPASITWPRTLDMNDRELRYTVIGLGGKAHGVPRENEFIITAASEVMAVLALASRPRRPPRAPRPHRRRVDRRRRAGHGGGAQGRGRDDRGHEGRDQAEPRADARGPAGARARRAVRQHRARRNSIVADRIALKLGRLRRHRGGVRERPRLPEVLRHRVPRRRVRAERRRARDDGARDQVARRHAVRRARRPRISTRCERGADNLAAHIDIVRQYGLPCVVAINSFPTDTDARDRAGARARARGRARRRWSCTAGSRKGGEGAVELANAVVDGVRASRTRSRS